MYTLDYKDYAKKIREAVAESVVLLKNDYNTLPIKKDEVVSVFGRAQIDTYYCGTGSGGMVNIPYLVNVVEGIAKKRKINETLLDLYKEFITENPFDKGQGWAMEPFSQVELELEEAVVKEASEQSDLAVVVIGRLAGEDKDVLVQKGSYYLGEIEEKNIELITKYFKRTVVMLNVGGIMDMSFVTKYNPSAVMYAWHGGVESGNGYADVLCGDVCPSGALPDSIAYKLEDYPSTSNFGDGKKNFYQEDIFVGYRYFETFSKETLMYPFGYSLSYTDFEVETKGLSYEKGQLVVDLAVKNRGEVAGKKAIQVYIEAPIDQMCKAARSLVAFHKTDVIAPNESETIQFVIEEKDFASFSEQQTAFVLEKGNYTCYVGFNASTTQVAGEFVVNDEKIIEKVTHALAPIEVFDRMVSIKKGDGYEQAYEKVNRRRYDIKERIQAEKGESAPQTHYGYTFDQVKQGEISVYDFVCDLSNKDLIHMTRGEGMCSPKVTPGTAGTYGGVTHHLNKDRKLPLVCCADGPSGIRMDCGTMAMSVPNGTALASTFNTQLNESLFEYVALEMVKNNIDTLLGPGMNIHRSPLCGRNFEYFSEDPYLTGKMAAAQLRAMHKYGVTGAIKHFALNNQEFARKLVDAVVSERAIREIYLKGFEIAVKEGEAFTIMTAYNPINQTQAASNYDLNTTILRKDWGYDGVVMTDWWATMNKEGEEADVRKTADMIISQNDLFMVTASSEQNEQDDNSEQALEQGELTRYELVRSGINIVKAALKLNCSREKLEIEVLNTPENKNQIIIDCGSYTVKEALVIDQTVFDTKRGNLNRFALTIPEKGRYRLDFELRADAAELAQVPMTTSINGASLGTKTLQGGKHQTYSVEFDMVVSINAYCELFFGETGMVIESLKVTRV